MQHEVIVLISNLMLETNKHVDYSKFVPTIMSHLNKNDILSEEFIMDWHSGKLDSILSQHFLFKRELNDKLKELALPFINHLKQQKEEEESSSEEKSDSDGDSEGKSDESSSKSDNEDDD